jgi:hypothetical protein
MLIGQQVHQVQVVVDRTVANAIHALSRPHAIVVEWRSVDAIVPRVIANFVKNIFLK